MSIEERIEYAKQKMNEAFRNGSLQGLNYWDGYKTAMEHILDKGFVKPSAVARAIFEEINEIKYQYANGLINGGDLYVKLYMLEKKYTEGEG